jgi:hypothetical protein
MSYQHRISVHTKGHGDVHDLTEQVASIVNSSGIQTGTVNVFNVEARPRSALLSLNLDCSVTCPPFWTSSSRPAATTATSRRGMTVTGIRTCKRHCWGQR